MFIIKALIFILISYLIGSISFSVIFSKLFSNIDIRQHGSGNAGATNTLRVAGKKAAIFTAIGDVLKGTTAVMLAKLITENDYIIALSSIAVVCGHVWPLYFGFKGGKAVATLTGILLFIDYRVTLILVVIFAVALILSRMVSFASITAALMAPVVYYFINPKNSVFLLLFVFSCGFVIVLHRHNLKRIFKGNENKINFGGRKK